MKIENVPGEFGFRALIKWDSGIWGLSEGYFLNEDEVKAYIHHHEPEKSREFKFPVEVNDNGSIYVPHEDELK